MTDQEGLAAALRFTAAQASEGVQSRFIPHQFTIDGIKKQRFYTLGGVLQEKTIDLPLRKHLAFDLDSFVALVKRFEAADPTIWHGENSVQAVLNDEWRDEYVSYALPPTAARSTIFTLAQKTWEQAELISLIKSKLAGSGVDDALLLQLRSVNFVKFEQAVGEVTPRSHSFGNSAERKLVDVRDDFPDVVLARFAWWNIGAQVLSPAAPRALADGGPEPNSAALDTRVAVRIAIEIDFAKKGFRLLPLEDDLERARQHAQRMLHEWLVAELEDADAGRQSIPVYHGQP